MRKSLGNIVVKDIKSTSLFRPKLLKKLKVSNGKLFKDRKTYLNVTAIFGMYIFIIKIKGIKFNTEGLTAKLQNLFIKFLISRRGISKVI